MHSINKKIIIIGAGLTGLSLAYQLKKKGFDYLILEARARVGGRIHTLYADALAPLEMGATWLGAKHSLLNETLQELQLGTFIQELGKQAIYEALSLSPPQVVNLPLNTDPSFRIQGGSSQLIQAFAERLDEYKIHLNQRVTDIIENADGVLVKTKEEAHQVDVVVSTLPPYLLVNNIVATPDLPADFLAVAKCTHTWMGESIKIALTYETPFWRRAGSSGTIFSNVGPIPEMYDHSNFEDDRYALKGFLNGGYFSLSKSERLDLILGQLKKYYGDQAQNYLSYEETVWRNEPDTFADYEEHLLPHQNNGHEVFKKPLMNNKCYVAGSETASAFPGYMEGALHSAQDVLHQILNTYA